MPSYCLRSPWSRSRTCASCVTPLLVQVLGTERSQREATNIFLILVMKVVHCSSCSRMASPRSLSAQFV